MIFHICREICVGVLSIQIFFFSQGYFIQPTVIETSDPQDKIMQEVFKINYLKNLIL